MKTKIILHVGLVAFGVYVQPGLAVPVQIPYSGQLAESGELVNGQKLMKFEIVDGASAVRYDSGEVTVPVVSGAFSVVLGGTNVALLDSSVFDGTPRFLRVTVESVLLSPLQPVRFTPHSVHAITSGSASNAAIAAGVVPNAITAASIADGSVTPAKLNTTAASPGQFLGQDGSTAQWAFITLNAGPGLLGGGSDWPQNLSVSFGGDGASNTVAHSDHNHKTNTVDREFVVQYRESDFSFASRLMEEEGIYYYFQHESAGNKIVLADGRAGTNHAGPDLELRAGDGAGTNQSGGSLILRTGTATGTGVPGVIKFGMPVLGPEFGVDNVVAPGAMDYRANNGTDPVGTLRYSFLSDHWEIANDGGPFRSIATLGLTGTLSPSQGGLGSDISAAPLGSILIKANSGDWSALAPGLPGQVLAITPNDPSYGSQWGWPTLLNPGVGIALTPTSITSTGLVSIDTAVVPQLGVSNRFTGPITFTKPVEFETNAYFQIKFSDLLVSSFRISGQGGGDPVPTESVSFNFDTITHAYTNGLTNGASLKFKAADAIAPGATGGDIQFKPGSGASGGSNGVVALVAQYTKFQPDGTPLRAVMNVGGNSNAVTLSAVNTNLDHHGPDIVVQGGDAAGSNKNGGAIVVRPGTSTGGTKAPLMIETELVELHLTSVNPLPFDLAVQRGSNASGVLRYGTNDLWQIANGGGPFRSVATLDSDGLLDASKLGGVSASSFARLDSSSQLFTGSNAFAGPVSFFGPGSEPFFVGTNANKVANLNCDRLDGISSEVFARLDLSNHFAAPVTFTKSVEHETNAYFKVKFSDLLVSSFSISGHGGGDPVPTESVSFNFETISLAYTNQLTNGASLKFKAADAIAPGATGGDIDFRPGAGAPGGQSGSVNLGSDTIKLGDALPGQDVLLVVDQNPGQPHIRYDWANDLWKFATAGGIVISLDGNADTLDGLDSTTFAQLEQDNLWAGAQTFAGGLSASSVTTVNPVQGAAAKAGAAINTATPSVANLTTLQLVNYLLPTDITELQDGVEGQVIVLVGGNNPAPPVVRDGSGQINLAADWPALLDHTLTLCRVNGRWLETSRSVN